MGRAEIGDLHLEPAAHLPIGVLGKTNCARLRNALEPRGDIDAVAHQVAVALLDDVADVNADAEFDSPVLRHAGVALDEAVLNLDRAADGVHDAAKLDNASIAGALDDAAVMSGDGRVDEVAAEPPQARKPVGHGGHRASKLMPHRDFLQAARTEKTDITLQALCDRLSAERGQSRHLDDRAASFARLA